MAFLRSPSPAMVKSSCLGDAHATSMFLEKDYLKIICLHQQLLKINFFIHFLRDPHTFIGPRMNSLLAVQYIS